MLNLTQLEICRATRKVRRAARFTQGANPFSAGQRRNHCWRGDAGHRDGRCAREIRHHVLFVLIIIYLSLSALFDSFLDPVVSLYRCRCRSPAH